MICCRRLFLVFIITTVHTFVVDKSRRLSSSLSARPALVRLPSDPQSSGDGLPAGLQGQRSQPKAQKRRRGRERGGRRRKEGQKRGIPRCLRNSRTSVWGLHHNLFLGLKKVKALIPSTEASRFVLFVYTRPRMWVQPGLTLKRLCFSLVASVHLRLGLTCVWIINP